jgi:hypothetical protein
MQEQFDPYYKWLGIPPEDQPPTYYQLLGVRDFESDTEVIANNAYRQMGHVRSMQTGEYSDHSQRLLNELAKAKVCLLHPTKRAEYDEQLRAGPQQRSAGSSHIQTFSSLNSSAAASEPPPKHQPTSPHQEEAAREPRQKPRFNTIWLLPAGVACVGVVFFILLYNRENKRKADVAKTPAAAEASDSQPSTDDGTAAESNTAGSDAGASEREVTDDPDESTDEEQSPKSLLDGVDDMPDPPTESTTRLAVLWPEDRRENAKLFIDGRPLDPGTAAVNTPEHLEFEVAPGEHRVRVEWPDGVTFEQSAVVAAGETGRVTVRQTAIGPLDKPVADTPSPHAEPSNTEHASPESEPPGPVAEAIPPDVRLLVPSESQRDEAKRIIWETYGADLRSRKGAQKAHRLLAEVKIAENPVHRFVMFDLALDWAIKEEDVTLALQVVDRMAEGFRIDPFRAKASTLGKLAETRSEETEKQVAHAAYELTEEAMHANQFDWAEKFGEFALETARKTRYSEPVEKTYLLKNIVARNRSIEGYREDYIEEYEQLQTALKTLTDNPKDSEANEVAGRYLCFRKGNFERGLPMLALGRDAKLKELAKAELSEPTSAHERLQIGDAWWDLSTKFRKPASSNQKRRAVAHYQSVVASLDGAERRRIKKRLEQLKIIISPVGLNGLELMLTFDKESVTREDDIPYFEDRSGKGNRGTVVKVGMAEGVAGEAAAFDGKETGVFIPRVVSDDFTISLWVRSTQEPTKAGGNWMGGRCLVDGEVPWNYGDFGTSVDGGYFVFGTGIGESDKTIRSVSRVADGRWHHCCAVRHRESGRITVFVDGRLQAAGVNSSHSLSKPPRLAIGQRQTGGGHFAGLIDELSIFSRCLTPNEVFDLYQFGMKRESLATFLVKSETGVRE